ncbi:DUF3300 domain-containing protein [Colwellia sp. MEBiC06753]
MKLYAFIGLLLFAAAPVLANQNYPLTPSIDTEVSTGEQQNTEQAPNLLSEGELAQILAPIALYPDTLLSHILIAASYPLEVIEAYRWRQQHLSLESDDIAEQLASVDWDESVKAIVPFDRVLNQLNDDLNWMQQLGYAFLAQEQGVLDAIQELRYQAQQAGSLDNLTQASVEYDDEKIIIAPRRTEVIYVPYYDTRIVYGNWRWQRYPPVYWYSSPYNYYHPIAWSSGVHIGVGFFFSAVHWHHRYVVINHHKPRFYRKRHQILYSGYSKRWSHKPIHRKNVAYRHPVLAKKYQRNAVRMSAKIADKNQARLVRSHSAKEVKHQLAKRKQDYYAPSNGKLKAKHSTSKQISPKSYRNKEKQQGKWDRSSDKRHYVNKEVKATDKRLNARSNEYKHRMSTDDLTQRKSGIKNRTKEYQQQKQYQKLSHATSKVGYSNNNNLLNNRYREKQSVRGNSTKRFAENRVRQPSKSVAKPSVKSQQPRLTVKASGHNKARKH